MIVRVTRRCAYALSCSFDFMNDARFFAQARFLTSTKIPSVSRGHALAPRIPRGLCNFLKKAVSADENLKRTDKDNGRTQCRAALTARSSDDIAILSSSSGQRHNSVLIQLRVRPVRYYVRRAQGCRILVRAFEC